MKIAMVVTGGLHPSGTEQVVPWLLTLFERLAKSHEIHAFALRHLEQAQTYALRGFTVHDLGRPSAPLGFRRAIQERALYRALSAVGGFDIVHGFWGDPAGLVATRAARTLRIPSVVTCDSGEFTALPAIAYGSQRTARGRKAITEACASAARVHVCTQFMASLAAKHGIQTTLIPSVCGLAPAADGPSASDRLRLLQVASLSQVKNQRLLIDALALVRATVDAHLDLVGEDTLGSALQRHAGEKGLEEHVTFHGFLPQDRLPARFAAADVYAQSSLHEGGGVSVLEAAAMGVPIVGTRVGYVADWAGLRATAIDKPDPQLMADAILALHADPARRQSLAAAASQWTREQDAETIASRFDEMYQECLIKPSA